MLWSSMIHECAVVGNFLPYKFKTIIFKQTFKPKENTVPCLTTNVFLSQLIDSSCQPTTAFTESVNFWHISSIFRPTILSMVSLWKSQRLMKLTIILEKISLTMFYANSFYFYIKHRNDALAGS